ncbi:unnamed protein product [Orchesella dallaii]|uniref:histone acetyltransferase n=1 Tax=Orchesella dallaii TaxID=48710 RepID=A0ABP1RRK4_9HEXA
MGKERGRSRQSGSQVRHGGKPYERREVNSSFPHPRPAVEKDEKSERPPSEATKTPIPFNREVFKEVFIKLCRLEPEGFSCKHPFDPEKNRIPDSPQEIKRPMALSSVLDKLNNSVYLDPWEIIEETWTILDNVLLYNHKNSEVYQYFTKLAKVAEAELTLVMLGLGYCCAKKYSFDPHPLHCFGKKQEEKCSIMEGTTYYLYEDTYAICETCFNVKKNKKVVTLHRDNYYDSPSETDARYPLDGSGVVPLPILPSQLRQIFVRKEEFVTKKNNELEPEHKVQCNRCQRWLYN